MKTIKISSDIEIPRYFTGKVLNTGWYTGWYWKYRTYKNNWKYRTYKNGKLHSYNDEPAMVKINDEMFWYKNGKIHRDNGKPAAIYSIGMPEYWINGNPVTKEAAQVYAMLFLNEI